MGFLVGLGNMLGILFGVFGAKSGHGRHERRTLASSRCNDNKICTHHSSNADRLRCYEHRLGGVPNYVSLEAILVIGCVTSKGLQRTIFRDILQLLFSWFSDENEFTQSY
jgi:hypothetical protein